MAPKRRKSGTKTFKFLFRMKKKLFIVFMIIVAVLIGLIGRLAYVELKSGDRFEKIVLSQQEYSSISIPFRRGDIVDRKGTVMATSTDVYNVILDCSVITSKEKYLEPTMAALEQCFGQEQLEVSFSDIRTFIEEHPDRRYYVIAKKLPYETVAAFDELSEEDSNIQGIWFEKEYIREYPYGSLASAVIGYMADGNVGIGGVEDYYNDTLNGVDGRQYGYLNSDSNYEINIKDAVNGETVVTTIDANLQSIVESKMKEFYDRLINNFTDRGGASHIAVLIMDPNTGEVLSMADYPNYNYTISSHDNLSQFYTEEEIQSMDKDAETKALEALKQNFAITYTYEPGSTAKPFTVACGLDTGSITSDMTFECDGYEEIADFVIHCVNRSGHGTETVSGALQDSCNDALMQMSYRIGAQNFAKYQQLFNFGLRTNIDLPGESRTSTLIYHEDELSTINLATNSFGQNFNVTMIQLASAYSSMLNGGKYYLPHMVSKLEDERGNTVEEIKPTLLKETISENTAELLREYLKATVEEGTGKVAKVDGYSMCGKTGTAQKYIPDENGNLTSIRDPENYLVSFIGSVPADHPEVIVYAIVDEPNVEDQAHSNYAQNLVREILKEALPYLNIYPDEELTGVNQYLDVIGNDVRATEENETVEQPAQSAEQTEDTTTGQSGDGSEPENSEGDTGE